MAIQMGPQGTVLVDLPGGSELQEELGEVAELVRNRDTCDVVMDFSQVTVFNSTCLAALLRLRQQLRQRGRRLVLCNIGDRTHGILAVTGLTGVFEISSDRQDALAMIRRQAQATCH